MPFSYLRDFASDANVAQHGDNRDKEQQGGSSSIGGNVAGGMDSSPFSATGGIQFQMPSFLLPPQSGSMASMLGPEMYPTGFSSSFYDQSMWSQSPTDKSKSYANSSKTGVHYTEETTLPATSSSRANGKQTSSLPFEFADTPMELQDVREDEYISSPTPAGVDRSFQSPSSVEFFSSPDVSGAVQAPASDHLPVYSQSGFDMLAILGRIATRPNPVVTLGPVDMSCAFVVSDVRLEDYPIIYASRSFLDLTGYSEREVIGKNCRFLQAPGGNVRKGDIRKSTSPEAVSELKWNTEANRECSVSLINYRKDGKPFVNRITIIPVPPAPDQDEVAYHVGFQVDLNESPAIIVQRIRDGNYYSDTGRTAAIHSPAERCSKVMSKELRGIIFQSSLPLTTSANVVQEKPSPRDAQQWLDLLLLEQSADFVHALSLKGQFLYASPSTRDELGYEPQDLLGVSIADVCHPSDSVPLLRELKESSAATPSGPPPPRSTPQSPIGTPMTEDQVPAEVQPIKTVDLLFRMRTKSKVYVWVECVGKLYSDAGKNRKAIILSGRICRMPSLQWDTVSRAGGLAIPSAHDNIFSPPILSPSSSGSAAFSGNTDREFWSILSPRGIFLAASTGTRSLLGWGPGEIIGRSLKDLVVPDKQTNDGTGEDATLRTLREKLWELHANTHSSQSRKIFCSLRTRDGNSQRMCAVMYGRWNAEEGEEKSPISRLVVQFKLLQQEQRILSQNQLTVVNPGLNILEELEVNRSSTWQYEVQQQRIANKKLLEDVKEMEADLL
ncbi:hypothetical protein SCHPADRAFT_903917 [Schizopora paradoxa]|uniref:PAS domain-containing protein n=1 Tax=Schizopora paradoxa TaxID=27342 RepID=A0A0H2RQ12_9AGAM|nr:hypothetical protein SCHPADRAFT_903917 [Schizopora paradoxa]